MQNRHLCWPPYFFLGPALSPHFLKSWIATVRRSAKCKTPSWRLHGMRWTFFRIYPDLLKFQYGECTNMAFLKNFKCKGVFLSFSFDFWLSRGSSDVFTGFLARSVQEIWLIKRLPVSSKISDLLLFLSYFTSQNKGIKFCNYFFDVCCVNWNILARSQAPTTRYTTGITSPIEIFRT